MVCFSKWSSKSSSGAAQDKHHNKIHFKLLVNINVALLHVTSWQTLTFFVGNWEILWGRYSCVLRKGRIFCESNACQFDAISKSICGLLALVIRMNLRPACIDGSITDNSTKQLEHLGSEVFLGWCGKKTAFYEWVVLCTGTGCLCSSNILHSTNSTKQMDTI